MEVLNQDDFENLRRQKLAELQEAATKERVGTPAWRQIFRERGADDKLGGYYHGWELSQEFMWVPVKPFESMAQLVERVQRGCGEMVRGELCAQCLACDPVIWGGFGDGGAHIWQHEIEQTSTAQMTWLDRLVSHFGYRLEMATETRKVIVLCPASRIIQMFRLVDVPPIPGTGVNRGAYPDHARPYGDPDATGQL